MIGDPRGNVHDQTLYCLDRFEGGWAHLQGDPGGATWMGMTVVGWEDFSGHRISAEELRAIPPDQILIAHTDLAAMRSGFFRIENWRPRLVAIDFAIHASRFTVTPILQRCCGAHPDGVFGRDTEAKANRMDPVRLATALLAARQRYHLEDLEQHAGKRGFARGWWARCAELLSLVTEERAAA